MKGFGDLLGRVILKVEGSVGDEEIIFHLDNGETCRLYHEQDCCECVTVEDICGDLDDCLNEPVLLAEEVTSGDNPPDLEADGYQDSFTWTFYKLATNKGHVTIRWYGTSNGYYSESVDVQWGKEQPCEPNT